MAVILLIEDDDAVREMLRQTLLHFGHHVVVARDGKEGISLFDNGGVDLLITDLVMPEKEGLEVLMEIRRRKSAVKIIAISGGGRMNATDYLRTAHLLGAAKTLVKPFSNVVLREAIDELLCGHKNPTDPPNAI